MALSDYSSTSRKKTPFWAKKHIATPATASEIRRALGVTKRESAMVTKLLEELGYLEKASTTASSKAGASTAAPGLGAPARERC